MLAENIKASPASLYTKKFVVRSLFEISGITGLRSQN